MSTLAGATRRYLAQALVGFAIAAAIVGTAAAEPAADLRAETQASLAPLHLATHDRAAAVSRELGLAARRALATQQAKAQARLALASEPKLAAAGL